jgi:hypothetical protein
VAEKPQKHAVERKEVIVETKSQFFLDLQDPPNTDVFCWQSLSGSNRSLKKLVALVRHEHHWRR